MREFEDHVEYALAADPLGKFFGAHAVGFAHREQIGAGQHVVLEFMQIVQNAFGVGGDGMNRREAVCCVRLCVGKIRLLDVCDGIQTESADAFVDPELCRVVERLPDFRICPVQVGLLL